MFYLAYILKVTTGCTNIKYTIQKYGFTCSKILHKLHRMQLIIRLQIILGVFRKFPTVIISSWHVCPSVHPFAGINSSPSWLIIWMNKFSDKNFVQNKTFHVRYTFSKILPFTRDLYSRWQARQTIKCS